jgi:hypothetical protein
MARSLAMQMKRVKLLSLFWMSSRTTDRPRAARNTGEEMEARSLLPLCPTCTAASAVFSQTVVLISFVLV